MDTYKTAHHAKFFCLFIFLPPNGGVGIVSINFVNSLDLDNV